MAGAGKGIDAGDQDLVSRLRRDIELLVERLHRRRVLIADTFEVGFVDREKDSIAVLEGVARVRTYGGVVVLYGPKGCGKSTFFETLVEAIREIERDVGTHFEAAYVRWDDANRVVSAIGSGSVSEIIFDAIKSLDPSVFFDGRAVVSTTLSLGRFFGRVIEAVSLSRKAKDQGRILVVMDERRIESGEDAREFERELEDLADNVRRTNLKYHQEKGGFLTAIVLTSDALAVRAWEKIDGKVLWSLIWNLPRRDFEKLIDQLNISMDKDLLWRLAGGNPRALEEIIRRGLHSWISTEIIRRVSDALNPLRERDPQLLEESIRAAVDNPDTLNRWYDRKEFPLTERLLAFNISLRIIVPTEVGEPGKAIQLISELPEEPWIGEEKEYAFQIPAYYYTLKAMARKRGMRVRPEEVVEEAKKS